MARLDVFGSALRQDFKPGESDLDPLVDFRAHKKVALYRVTNTPISRTSSIPARRSRSLSRALICPPT
ncbi:MAG: hypothetical protein ABSG63_11015 [Spirochaetia bacterium]